MSISKTQWLDLYNYNGSADDALLPEDWPSVSTLQNDPSDPIYSLWEDAKNSCLGAAKGDRACNAFGLLKERCERHPEKPALIWLDAQGNEEACWQYEEFLDKIRRVAYKMKQIGIKEGDRVICCFSPGLEFFVAFWACLSLGAVAVPVCPPDPFIPNSDLGKKLAGIIRDCQPKCGVTDELYTTAIKAGKVYLTANSETKSREDAFDSANLQWVITDNLKPVSKIEWDFEVKENPKGLAFLQYTSGSTGEPKGVMVTHENLHQNVVDCVSMTHSVENFLYYKYSVGVSWLPTFHDMGLIGFHVSLMVSGCTIVGFSPVHFIQDPVLWLKVMSRYKRVISGAPPFALDLCVRKVQASDLAAIDLRRVAGIILGAEPIRHQSLEDFAQKFECVNFARRAYLPCYGLAENVLLALGKLSDTEPPISRHVDQQAFQDGKLVPISESEEKGIWLVSSGAQAEVEDRTIVRIVNQTTCIECPHGTIGEIWVTGLSKTAGYWNRPVQTEEVFGGKIAGATNPETQRLVYNESKITFIRTGDMGAILDKQLFVTGRFKDCIILNGVKYHPHDIENCVSGASQAIKPGRVTAVAIKDDSGKEHIAILFELRDKTRTQTGKLRQSQCTAIGNKVT